MAILLEHKGAEIARLQNIIADLADRAVVAEARLRDLQRTQDGKQ